MNDLVYRILKESNVSISSPRHFSGHIDINKFAELIVRECIKAYNDDGYQTEYEQDLRVLQHFGVEE